MSPSVDDNIKHRTCRRNRAMAALQQRTIRGSDKVYVQFMRGGENHHASHDEPSKDLSTGR